LCPDLENSCRDDQRSKKEPNRLEFDRDRGLQSRKNPENPGVSWTQAARVERDAQRRIEALYEAIPKSAGGMKPISRRNTEYGLYESPTSPRKRREFPGASPDSRGDGAAPPRTGDAARLATTPPPEGRAPDRPRLFP
jgi:hypothetical protein